MGDAVRLLLVAPRFRKRAKMMVKCFGVGGFSQKYKKIKQAI